MNLLSLYGHEAHQTIGISAVTNTKASPQKKKKATWFCKIILFSTSPSRKGSKFQAYIHIYINVFLSKTQTGRKFLQTVLPLDSAY